jgi:hypothetical protein
MEEMQEKRGHSMANYGNGASWEQFKAAVTLLQVT